MRLHKVHHRQNGQRSNHVPLSKVPISFGLAKTLRGVGNGLRFLFAVTLLNLVYNGVNGPVESAAGSSLVAVLDTSGDIWPLARDVSCEAKIAEIK